MPHFLAKIQRLEHFDAVAVAQQFAKEIAGGTDVIGEVGIVWGGLEFTLRVVQGQGAQVVGHPLMGSDNDVGHRSVSGQHGEGQTQRSPATKGVCLMQQGGAVGPERIAPYTIVT